MPIEEMPIEGAYRAGDCCGHWATVQSWLDLLGSCTESPSKSTQDGEEGGFNGERLSHTDPVLFWRG